MTPALVKLIQRRQQKGLAMLTKKNHYRPIPKDAEIVARRGRKYARWTNSRGVTNTRPVNDKCDRIVCESRHWYVRLKDCNGNLVERKAYTDKTASHAMEVELFTRLERGEAGLLDPMEEHRKKPLKKHLDDFEGYLRDKGNTADYVERTIRRCEIVFEKIKAGVIADITPGRVETCLADLRREGLSISSSNHYLRAVRNFCRWMVKERRIAESPAAGLKLLKLSESDKKRRRRNLTDEEFAALITATRNSNVVFRHLTGPDRVVLYTVAANTGLRASELASLTLESFDLNSPTPTVRCLAAYTKNGEEAILPLRVDVAAMMRDYSSSKDADEYLWPGSWARSRAGAAMIKADLEAAGVPYQDASDRFADFHSLRHTFISNLARAGVHPKNAQALARHSTIDLTMNVYTHTVLGDLANAVESLPAVPVEVEEVAALAATGTNGRIEDDSRRRSKRRNFSDLRYQNMAIRGNDWRNRPAKAAGTRPKENPLKSGVLSSSGDDCHNMSPMPEEGLEPSLPCENGILNPARLPIPPLRLI